MTDAREEKVEKLLESMAAESTPDQVEKIDRQFSDKLARLEANEQLSEDTLDKLRVLWKLLRQPDSKLPWKAQALVMAALSYFINPFDVIPDVAGKAGYADDALVVRIVYARLGDLVNLVE